MLETEKMGGNLGVKGVKNEDLIKECDIGSDCLLSEVDSVLDQKYNQVTICDGVIQSQSSLVSDLDSCFVSFGVEKGPITLTETKYFEVSPSEVLKEGFGKLTTRMVRFEAKAEAKFDNIQGNVEEVVVGMVETKDEVGELKDNFDEFKKFVQGVLSDAKEEIAGYCKLCNSFIFKTDYVLKSFRIKMDCPKCGKKIENPKTLRLKFFK